MSSLLTFGMKLDRERFSALLARIGDPHKHLRCVHVAGTNGKGSTTTFTASILRAAGFRVGAYLSPYVFDLRERIMVDGTMIPRADFARHVAFIRPHIEAVAETELGQTTEFELKTAVAFRHFAEIGVDFAVIEVGIGGRLDATNVIPPPLAAVITNIGLDHQKILGETLDLIAAEKAGILKTGSFAATAVADGPAWDTISRIAAERDVPILRVRRADQSTHPESEIVYEGTPEQLTLRGPGIEPEEPYRLGLRGQFQAVNAATAFGAIHILRTRHGIEIPERAVREGLRDARIPGRFQVLRPQNQEHALIVLDVAHNEDGARVLIESLRTDERFAGRRLTFVVGMSRNHEPEPFLEILKPLVARLIVTAPTFRPKPAAETYAAAQKVGFPEIALVEPARAAIAQAVKETTDVENAVVVTGSFYTVGETPPALLATDKSNSNPRRRVRRRA